jgi:hypothetical protein
VEGPLFPTGDPHSEKTDTGLGEIGRSALGVAEVGVPGVDDHVAGVEQPGERGDELVDRCTGLDHADDDPRRIELIDHLVEFRRWHETLAAVHVEEFVDARGGAVVDDDGSTRRRKVPGKC